MEEKLDSFSKILIATGQINYMASSINSVNMQIKTVSDDKGTFKHRIDQRDKALADAVCKLGEVMEDLGDLINVQDCISPIDERVSNVPFEIIIHGKDEIESLIDLTIGYAGRHIS